ncbi:hypothetical protein [Demequina globuliformis]|uniref:hypothetical protein n=1 Tax=Demequina globuliformis TaxID=676202 RepID=UPI0007822308|nr:hypothetical protein [Demequina globuliformis]
MSTAVLNRSDRRRPEAAKAAAVEDWSLVNQVHDDPAPLASLHRRAVVMAVIACAIENDDRVHASTLRPLLPEGVNDHLVGNVISHLAKAGILGETGRMLRSGDARNRNSRRRLPERIVLDWDRLKAQVA